MDPKNCFRSTAKPMVTRNSTAMKRPRSKLPRSLRTAGTCARMMEKVVMSRMRPALRNPSPNTIEEMLVAAHTVPKPMASSQAISWMDHSLEAISSSWLPSPSSSDSLIS